jgi:uncharacterized protein (TIGR02186 family)
MMRLAFIMGFVLLVVAMPARAQTVNESIEIGLSTDTIRITTDFSGEELTVFGAVDGIDRKVLRQGRYDIFLIMEGPRSDIVVRRKDRVAGIWMNVEDRDFKNVPQSYLVASTRQPRDITDRESLRRLGLDEAMTRIVPSQDGTDEDETEAVEGDDFSGAVIAIKNQRDLFALFPGNVRFLSQSLFRAGLQLPANIPLGTHRVRAYLFNGGQLVAQTSSPLRIAKDGMEVAVFDFAHEQPLWYGFACVLVALCVGWLGRVLFRKD